MEVNFDKADPLIERLDAVIAEAIDGGCSSDDIAFACQIALLGVIDCEHYYKQVSLLEEFSADMQQAIADIDDQVNERIGPNDVPFSPR